MHSRNKQKTAAIPHRIMNKTSIYLAKQSKVDRADHLGYEAIVVLDYNQSITIQSSTSLTPQDGKIFEFVLAQWQATEKVQNDLGEIDINIEEIIYIMGWKNRTENRKKIIQHLKHLLNVTISYKFEGGEVVFHLLEFLRTIDCTKTICIKVAQTYIEALMSAGQRYINVSDNMRLKGKYAIELAKLLKIEGGGVGQDKRSKLKKNIEHKRICDFLHLDNENKVSKDIVSRAFRELSEKINYPMYSYNSRIKCWKIKSYINT